MLLAKQVDFIGYGPICSISSAILVVISLVLLAFVGLQFGLDFTSGTSVRLSFSETVVLDEVNSVLQDNGYNDALVVSFGSDREIRIIVPVDGAVAESDQAANAVVVGESIAELLGNSINSEITLEGSDYVSSKVGSELAEQGGLGILVCLGIILVYVAMRFQFKFALGAVIALAHDVIITAGTFSVFQMKFDLSILAAILAIIGYSINDTIVVMDRIRENFRRMRKATPREVINYSLNQTLDRTLITSGTTLIVVLAVLFVGGDATRGFCIAMTLGITIGTYSSIYIAAYSVLLMKVTKEDLMPPVREGADLENIP